MKKYRKLVFTLTSALATSHSLAVDVVAGTNTETVTQIVVLETTGGVQAAAPLTFNAPATTTRIRDSAVLQSLMIDLNGGTTLGTFDRYTAEVNGFTAILGQGTNSAAAPGSSSAASGLISVLGLGGAVDKPDGGGADPAFVSALEATHSNGDLVNYIRVDGVTTNSATWNVQFDDTTGFDSTDFLIVEERNGNTSFSLTALDLSGVVIEGAVLNFAAPSYQWDTGYISASDPFDTQNQVLSVIDLSLFNTTEAIGGFFVDDSGNADIKLFIGTAVPEPTSTGLIALSGLALLLRRRR